MEAELVAKDGRRTPFFFSGTRLEIDGQSCVAGMGFDISKRRQAEAVVEDRERRLSLFYQNVADCLYMISVEDGERYRFISVNEAFLTVTGFRRDEVVGRYVEEVLPETSRGLVREKYGEAIRENRTVRWEEVAEMPAGRRIGEVFITPVHDEVAGRLFLLGGVHDVTERMQAEEQLRASREQLRALSARLLSAREEERKSIAREIHDELGQALTGLIIELSWLEDKLELLPDEEAARPLRAKTASMLRLADSTVESVRRIAAKLRPGLLDDFGLVAAIEWHAQEFEQRTGVSCRVTSELDETILSPEQATALFRIVQEALTNVARHAAATTVQVRIMQDGNQLLLSVEDNGRGIGEEILSSARSLGVIGMRERATLLGGELQVTDSRDGGTRVVARVPVGSGAGEVEAA
jgi:PAS domain S-box-containing protein